MEHCSSAWAFLRTYCKPSDKVSPKNVSSVEITRLLFLISGYTPLDFKLASDKQQHNTCCFKYFFRSCNIPFNSVQFNSQLQRYNNARLTTKELISIEETFGHPV
jgi:hypothetical protein